MTLTTVTYSHHQQQFQSWLACPDLSSSTSAPAVLVFPDWSGCNTLAQQKAQRLAEAGYFAMAVDIYGDGRVGATNEEKRGFMQPLVQDRNLLRERVTQAFAVLKEQSGVDKKRVAAIGFCFGGLCALELAFTGAPLVGAVSFHGTLGMLEYAAMQKVSAKLLILHGYTDPMVLPAAVDEFAQTMEKAKIDWQVHMYGHTYHAFTNPQANDVNFGTVYDATADRRSWQTLQNFLQEIF